MIGAIVGDMVGAPYEAHSIKTKDFPFWSKWSRFTDDTVMTVAVAEALLDLPVDANTDQIEKAVIASMRKWGRRYPHAGYGSMF